MSTLSRLAGLIKDMSSRMDAAGCSTGCDDTTDVAKKAAQSYFRLLGSLMGQVTNYLCTSPTSAINDPVLCSADQIAVMFLQLVPATVALLRSPCPYNGAMCHGTVHELKKQLDDSTPSTLKTALAMTQHYVMVLTYDAKLNQSDCTGGGRCLSSDNVDYPYEVSTVQKQKDKLFQTMSEKFDHHFRELDNKQALRDRFTQLIAADVQLFEAVSKRMCSGQCVTKLILQFLGTTKSALLTLEQNMVKPQKLGADSFKGLVEVAYETNMYTLHSLDLLGCDESEEIANDVGLNYLKLVMDGAQEVTKEKLNEKLALIKVLKSIVETPSCSGKNMPRGYLTTSRSLIRAMTGAAQKLSELYSHADEETIVTSLNNLTEELIKVIKFSWSVLYRKHIGSCELFENAKTMFSNYFPAAADNIPARIDAATKLLIAEKELLNTLTGVSHTLRSDDTTLQKMLSSPLEQKEASKRIFESALGKLSPTSSDCHAALSTVLQAMIQVAQVNTA
ncbi:hypothetical protein D915_002693 [Fasciola hepatica]|uniref:Uncharacterized protein n=1 Tax=Fasciola hepatica TaxID=6192 RepID=A0A4E0RXJ3_FASHE|nr:hypothetical protein D915_002693 [Fasciola hepatica]